MKRETLIKKTTDVISRLSDGKLKEVSDYAEFLLSKTEDKRISEAIQNLAMSSKTFQFLEDEEDLYTTDDLK